MIVPWCTPTHRAAPTLTCDACGVALCWECTCLAIDPSEGTMWLWCWAYLQPRGGRYDVVISPLVCEICETALAAERLVLLTSGPARLCEDCCEVDTLVPDPMAETDTDGGTDHA